MTIITSVPPPEAPGAAARIAIGAASAVTGPLRFIGRALRTLWSNGKARAGLIILGIIILVAVCAPVLAPHSPTATTFTPYLGPNHGRWPTGRPPGRCPAWSRRRPWRARARRR